MGKSGTNLMLDWLPSCSTADSDYEIYQGDIGSWNSHTQLLCTTAGAATATIGPGAGNHYYLVVPTNGTTEGSYGRTSADDERPTAAAPCGGQSQSVGDCP